jgi:arabinofuranan 3-O-arabinosyltransferase
MRALGRWRDGVVCAVLTLLAFIQSPGRIVADSKIDLAVNPVAFLGRALHVWDPTGSFGQIQNQVYGYLWPMGPFFTLGSALHLPAWVVQRLWWAVLLCVAYTGAVRLAARLGIGTPASRLVAGLAFALCPRILTELGSISSEAWPTAVAPWVLIPLVALRSPDAGLGEDSRRRTLRAIVASALAVGCIGGTNATATFAVVPVALLWLAGVQPWRRRLALLAGWCAAVAAATLWWLVALLVLGRYSAPFLDYIETAATTTLLTDPVTVLRGTNNWVAWLNGAFGPTMPAGFALATNPWLAGATVVVAVIGLAGLTRPSMPYRAYLVTSLLLGFTLVSLGHVSELPGTPAQALRTFLDGAGAPLRNIHKFDLLMRIPLLLGLAHLLDLAPRPRDVPARPSRSGGRRWRARWRAVIAMAGAVAAVTTVATPALAGKLAAPYGFSAVPGYWRDAADWLGERADEGRVLVIPGARFPNYTWGDTLDEILQPLASGPWAVRNAVPMGQPTLTRMLDAIEVALATGEGSPGLADYLARAGVRYLLVRNDLDYGRTGATAPLVVHQALLRSPGLSFVDSFGPEVGPEIVANGGLGQARPALEVVRVDRPVSLVDAVDASEVTTVVGGPESLLWLAAAGLLPHGPVVLAGDATGRAVSGPVLLTDGLRRRDVNFGTARDAVSSTLTVDGLDAIAAAVGGTTRDYLPDWAQDWLTTAAFVGIDDVRASSSAAQTSSVDGARPDRQPFAAVDGDPTTAWFPSPGLRLDGQWLEIRLAEPMRVARVGITFDTVNGALPTRVTVNTGAESSTVEVDGDHVVIPLQGTFAVRTIRLTITDLRGERDFVPYGLAEVSIPGVSASRTLVLPTPPASAAPATLLFTATPATPACYDEAGLARCDPSLARRSEDGATLDRTVTLGTAATYEATVWARPRPGGDLDALLDQLLPGRPTVTASSRLVDEPIGRPSTVVDGDPGTVWWPDTTDDEPWLRFTWPTDQVITGLRITTADGIAATEITKVTVRSGGQSFTARLIDGEIRFDRPLRTQELTLLPIAGEQTASIDAYHGRLEVLPVAVGEVAFLTADPAATGTPALDRSAALDLPCGSGPSLRVGDQVVRTRLTGTVGELLTLRELPAVACGSSTVDLVAGQQRLVADPSPVAVATRVALVAPGAAPQTPVRAQDLVHRGEWSATHRTLTIDAHAGDLVLTVRENTNRGWRARLGDVTLQPIVVDGWQQGWLVPAGLSGEVVLDFPADAVYHAGLVTGAVLLLVLVVLALLTGPRGRRPRRAQPTADTAPTVATADTAPTVAAASPAGTAEPTGLAWLVGGASLALTGGMLGVLVLLAALAVVALRPQPPVARRPGRAANVLAWAAPVTLAVTGALSFAIDGTHRSLWPHVLGLLAVTFAWLAVVTPSSANQPSGRSNAGAPSPRSTGG